MQIRGLLLGAAVVALSVTSASATMRIAEDRGGQIGHYLRCVCNRALVRRARRSSMEIVCPPARLVLGVVPARAYMRHLARALRLSCSVDAGSRRTADNESVGNAGALEHLSGLGAAMDHSGTAACRAK